jgi:hypothetical protein
LIHTGESAPSNVDELLSPPSGDAPSESSTPLSPALTPAFEGDFLFDLEPSLLQLDTWTAQEMIPTRAARRGNWHDALLALLIRCLRTLLWRPWRSLVPNGLLIPMRQSGDNSAALVPEFGKSGTGLR